MLINTVTEIIEFIAIPKDTDFNRIKPHLVSVESAFIKPILGEEFLAELESANVLLTAATPPTGLSDDEMNLLLAKGKVIWCVKKAMIYLAYWSGFQILNAMISDSGFKRSESATAKGLYKYQEDDLRNHFKINGFDALDQILEKIEISIDLFVDFKKSTSWTIRKATFIPDTKTLSAIIPINNSRLTYLRLIPHFNLVEDINIKPLLGITLYDRIKAEMIKDDPDANLLKVIPHIQKPIAFLASALLMEESGADLTEKGLYFESFSAINLSDRNIAPAKADRIALLAKRNRMVAENYLEMLKSFLIADPSTFTDFAGTAGNIFRRDNNNKKTFWA